MKLRLIERLRFGAEPVEKLLAREAEMFAAIDARATKRAALIAKARSLTGQKFQMFWSDPSEASLSVLYQSISCYEAVDSHWLRSKMEIEDNAEREKVWEELQPLAEAAKNHLVASLEAEIDEVKKRDADSSVELGVTIESAAALNVLESRLDRLVTGWIGDLTSNRHRVQKIRNAIS
jgi:hypothetical protein